MKYADILCFGEPLFELNQCDNGDYTTGHGGDASNCAIAAARCGSFVGMLANIGDDDFGSSFIELWQKENIAIDTVTKVCDGETGLYFVTHDADGHHFTYRRRGSAASRITPNDLPVAAIESAKILHVSGISQAISPSASNAVSEAIKIANKSDVLVSYDTNLRLQLWPIEQARTEMHNAVADCDIVLPGLDDARALTNLSDPHLIVDFYLDLGCQIVALTLGKAGVLVATAEHRESIPPHSVKAVDANGAGDTFDGAFLSHYLGCKDPFAAAKFANAAAALSITKSGAVGSIPRKADIEKFMMALS